MKFSTFVNNIINQLDMLVPIIFGIALIIFLYGLFNYMSQIGDESKRKESIQYIIYGLIGLFIMLSIYGIVSVVTGSFFGQNAMIPQLR